MAIMVNVYHKNLVAIVATVILGTTARTARLTLMNVYEVGRANMVGGASTPLALIGK